MRKILLVSYHFPPDAAVGALRAAKFAKYLPKFAWEPLILTVKEKYYSSIDELRLRDVTSVRQIYRTRMLPHASQIYVRLKARLRRGQVETGWDKAQPAPMKKKGISSFLRRLYLSLEGLPDDKRVWILPAALVGLRVIVREQVDAILTSSPPMSCHVIGLLLKAMSGRRWVADFRDPWVWHRGDFGVPSTALSKAAEAWLERKTLTNADKVILTTERMQADLQRRYPTMSGKTAVILNGYDPEDFDGTTVSRYRAEPRRFTLTHAGTIYHNRTPDEFLVALSRLIQRGAIPRTRVHVNFIGISPKVREQSKHLGIDDVVSVVDAMSYRSCIESLCRSDVLLLFAQGQPLQIPTKFYDYIAVRRPILVLAQDGATADLARKLAGPIVVDPGDSDRLEAALRRLYSQFEDNSVDGMEGNTKVWQRELTKAELTRKLTELIS